MIDDSTQYIARISYGKDSLKMLDVIKSRGLPLDRITTTDVWATDTIPANLPPMMAFKERMDQIIWSMYHIEVEHLCAFNKDGTKRTYEQMFYHVPVRKNSQSLNVERERERESRSPSQIVHVEREREAGPERYSDSRICGADGARGSSRGMYQMQGSIKGFPGTVGVNWCQKLKICGLLNQRFPVIQEGQWSQMVPRPQDHLCFRQSAGRGAKT